ncbi:MAG: hypothetical protein ABIP94_17740 [Planctomycetota bacterium]
MCAHQGTAGHEQVANADLAVHLVAVEVALDALGSGAAPPSPARK